jgi:hypothetical protein
MTPSPERINEVLSEHGLSGEFPYYGNDALLGPTWWLSGITPVSAEFIMRVLGERWIAI